MPEPALQAIQELRARRLEVPHHGGNSDLVETKCKRALLRQQEKQIQLNWEC